MYLELDTKTVEELEATVGLIEKITGNTTLINADEIESIIEDLLYKIHQLEEEVEDILKIAKKYEEELLKERGKKEYGN